MNDFFLSLSLFSLAEIRQQQQMLNAENVELSFTDDAIKEIARVSFEVGKRGEE